MIALALVLVQEAASLARLSSIPIEEGYRIEEALTCDVTGEDVSDIVLALRGPKSRRLQVHVRRATGAAFSGVPDAVLELPADAVAFAAIDALPDEGREIALFDGTHVVAWRWREKDEKQRFTRLAPCELLWQLADEGELFHLQPCVADVDHDGLEDFVLPEPAGWRVALQKRAAGVTSFSLAEPVMHAAARAGRGSRPGGAEVRSPSGRRGVAFGFDNGGLRIDSTRGSAGAYLAIEEALPAAQIVDWDGDQDLDIVMLGPRALVVHVQEPRGTFDPGRTLVLESPVVRDRKRDLDVSFSARTLDLDADARADCVLFAGDQRSKDPRTQALVFLQKGVPKEELPLFGDRGAPRQLLVLDGFARPLAIEDVDGDGLPDLVAGAVRPDLIDALRTASSERLDTELYVYRNTGSGFSKRPDFVQVLSFQTGGSGDMLADFVGDVTNDGVRELIERTDRDRLRMHVVRKTREGLRMVSESVWELAIEPEARVLLPGFLMQRTPDLFVLQKGGVLCASFR